MLTEFCNIDTICKLSKFDLKQHVWRAIFSMRAYSSFFELLQCILHAMTRDFEWRCHTQRKYNQITVPNGEPILSSNSSIFSNADRKGCTAAPSGPGRLAPEARKIQNTHYGCLEWYRKWYYSVNRRSENWIRKKNKNRRTTLGP